MQVATDLFEFQGKMFLLIVDYYSRWIEVLSLADTKATTVIMCLKSVFSRLGIPDIVMSDNGPQYACDAFKQFVSSYQFTHVTSLPLFPQSNGEAERAVRTVKNIMTKSEDLHLSLLAYRSAPLHNGLSCRADDE